MKYLIIIFAIVFLYQSALAQNEDKSDSTYTFNDLAKILQDTTLHKDFEEDYMENIFISSGYFPGIFDNFRSYTFNWNFGSVIDKADNIRSSSFVPTLYPFSSKRTMSADQMNIMEKNKRDEEEDNGPASSLINFGIGGIHSLAFINSFVRAEANWEFSKGLLFTRTKVKHFINAKGEKIKMKEAGILTLDEMKITLRGGLLIPWYGGFLKSADTYSFSIYYLYGGLSYDHILTSESNQYMQIGYPKDKIRYDNGRDTLSLFHEKKLSTLNSHRLYLDLELGFMMDADGFGLNFAMMYSYPLTSVIKDEIWKQHKLCFRISFLMEEWPL